MIYNKRVDKNQPQIVKKFREYDVTVSHTHAIGQGFPDICVGLEGLSIIGSPETLKLISSIITSELVKKDKDLLKTLDIYHGVNFLVEIKDGKEVASKKKLTTAEEKWHNNWKGQAVIIESEEQIDDLLRSLDFSK